MNNFKNAVKELVNNLGLTIEYTELIKSKKFMDVDTFNNEIFEDETLERYDVYLKDKPSKEQINKLDSFSELSFDNYDIIIDFKY